MIAPTYQRAQLWRPARSRLHTTLLAAVIGVACSFALAYALWVPDLAITRTDITLARMTRAVERAAARCPHRLGDVMKIPLDAWGHAFEYRCTGSTLAIHSAGPDGAFTTPDDLWVPR